MKISTHSDGILNPPWSPRPSPYYVVIHAIPHPQEHEQFFTEPACKAMYKSSAAAIIGRVNSINGRQYRDDPTIMAWCGVPCHVTEYARVL